MAAELRWILLCLSLPLLAGIWWWTARRAGQIPGNSELREPTPSVDPPRHADSSGDLPAEPAPQPRDWGVPPFEPLNIRTAEFDHVPVLDAPMTAGTDPAPTPGSVRATAPAPARAPTPPPPMRPMFTTGPISEQSDRAAAAPPQAPNAAELQRIVTIRVCTVGEARWSGSQLMAALELHGLAFGRYQVFHRKHADGRSLFCVASLIEPGTFDIAEMADQEYRGVTLFAVLPGPIKPIETMDELLGTARGLAEELSGMVQDAKGMPLSPQRAAALREDIARFQASLPGN
ncbi:MAG TPA: cell division protein ZipA C-terminal FtsZ-binding domain-containing protein [Steroidobacteraceae bacterium]|nr:cell division protein ZipA C-terminal FtsZ-binding domain-containing protein [Steroidobacteraceae bacterium]